MKLSTAKRTATGGILFVWPTEERKSLRPLQVDKPLYIIEERIVTKAELISIHGSCYSVSPALERRKVRYCRYENFFIEILDGSRIVYQIELAVGRGEQVVSDRH